MSFGYIHLHTRASDGDVTPEMIQKSGARFVAATDHDTLEGYNELSILKEKGINVIPGVELTLTYAGQRFHVLVLEPEAQKGFDHCLAALQEQRMERIKAVIDRIESVGIQLGNLDWKKRKIPTKRDVASAALTELSNKTALEKLGITDPKTFGRYFYQKGPADIKIKGLPAEKVLSYVKGILILAHPGKSVRLPEQKSLIYNIVQRFPFAGIEVVTRKHSFEVQKICREVAGLLKIVPVTSNDVHSEAHLKCNQTPVSQIELLRLYAEQIY